VCRPPRRERFFVARSDAGVSVIARNEANVIGSSEAIVIAWCKATHASVTKQPRIAGAYLIRYVKETAWREDHRRMDNGTRVKLVSGLAMRSPVSVDRSGYWQRASH
jgi:hypothetical protein